MTGRRGRVMNVCKDCLYCQHNEHTWERGTVVPGECRRRAPVVIDPKTEIGTPPGRWPKVDIQEGWCGEWEAR